MLITSLALLARSRAWVVFRRVGVAAPARRRFRAIAQGGTAEFPDRFRVGRGCRAAARALAHLGSERGLRGLSERGLRGLRVMAVPSPRRVLGPPSAGRVPSPGAPPLSWHAIFLGNRLVTVDPVVGGSLEDASCCLFS
jgi:hypothetical protein